jgi:hypothetical protein
LHYHYLTIEQRQTLERLIRSQTGAGAPLDAGARLPISARQ